MNNKINDGGPAFGVDEVIPGVIVGYDLFNLRDVSTCEAGQPMALSNALSIWANEVHRKSVWESCSKSDRTFRDGRKLKDGLQRVQQKDELAIKRRKINRRIIAAQPRRFNGVALQGMQYSACDFSRRFVLLDRQAFPCVQRLQTNAGTRYVLQGSK